MLRLRTTVSSQARTGAALRIEAVGLPPQRQEHVLDDVLGLAPIVEQPRGQGARRIGVLGIQGQQSDPWAAWSRTQPEQARAWQWAWRVARSVPRSPYSAVTGLVPAPYSAPTAGGIG